MATSIFERNHLREIKSIEKGIYDILSNEFNELADKFEATPASAKTSIGGKLIETKCIQAPFSRISLVRSRPDNVQAKHWEWELAESKFQYQDVTQKFVYLHGIGYSTVRLCMPMEYAAGVMFKISQCEGSFAEMIRNINIRNYEGCESFGEKRGVRLKRIGDLANYVLQLTGPTTK